MCVCGAGAIALAEVLAESKHLTHVDLRENDIRVAGLMALQLAHRMNFHLVSLQTPKSFKVEQVSRVQSFNPCVLTSVTLFKA